MIAECTQMMNSMVADSMMWMMGGMSHQGKEPAPEQPLSANAADRLTTLQQHQALEAEIVEVTRIAELEAKREQLMSSCPSVSDSYQSKTAGQGNPVSTR